MTFLGLYTGDSVASAQLIAVTSDEETVGAVARFLREREAGRLRNLGDDKVGRAYSEGRHQALRMVTEGEQ